MQQYCTGTRGSLGFPTTSMPTTRYTFITCSRGPNGVAEREPGCLSAQEARRAGGVAFVGRGRGPAVNSETTKGSCCRGFWSRRGSVPREPLNHAARCSCPRMNRRRRPARSVPALDTRGPEQWQAKWLVARIVRDWHRGIPAGPCNRQHPWSGSTAAPDRSRLILPPFWAATSTAVPRRFSP